MSRQPSRLVTTKHAFRRDSNGNPATKSFPRRIWDKIPKIHQWVDGVKIEHDKMGWTEVAETHGAEAPSPLKAPAPKAAPKVDKSGPLHFE